MKSEGRETENRIKNLSRITFDQKSKAMSSQKTCNSFRSSDFQTCYDNLQFGKGNETMMLNEKDQNYAQFLMRDDFEDDESLERAK